MPTNPNTKSEKIDASLVGTNQPKFFVPSNLVLTKQAAGTDYAYSTTQMNVYVGDDNHLYLLDHSGNSYKQLNLTDLVTTSGNIVSSAAVIDAKAVAAQGATIPNGRLFVPAAYWPTTGAYCPNSHDSATDSVSFSWLQECDGKLSSLSIYVLAVATPGNLNLSLCADSAGLPGAVIYSIGAVNSGSGAGWVRKVLDAAQQLTRNIRYHIVITGSVGASYQIPYTRSNATPGTGYTCNIMSYTKYDGAGSWTPATQTSLDTNFLVALNSAAGHNPQICYGQYNGQNIPIPRTGLMTIPQAGLVLDTSALTVSTLYYVYAYNNGGTLAIEAVTTVPVISAGLWVKTGTTDHLFLGLFYTVAGPNSVVSPIDCADWRGVANIYNLVPKQIGKRQLYFTYTVYLVNTSWVKWNGADDYKVYCVSWNNLMDLEAITCLSPPTGSHSMNIAFGIDSETLPSPYSRYAGQYSAGWTAAACKLTTQLPRGMHYIVPLVISAANNGLQQGYYDLQESWERGVFWC